MKKIKFLLITIAILGLSYTACEDMDIADIGIEKIEEEASGNTANTTNYPPLFVAVGGSDTTGKIYYSYLGTEWLAANFTGSRMRDVIYDENNKIFVAIGKNGKVWTSPDGVTWTEQTSNISDDLYRITSGDNIFAAVGTYNATDTVHSIITSSDGVNWTDKSFRINTTNIDPTALIGIAFHGNDFFTMENSGFTRDLYSANATSILIPNWETSGGSITASDLSINNLLSINGQLLAIGNVNDSGKIYYSVDGSSFETKDSLNNIENVTGIVYDGERYITVGNNNTNGIGVIAYITEKTQFDDNLWEWATSTVDGIMTGEMFNDIAYGGSNILIAVGTKDAATGIIYFSTDNGNNFSEAAENAISVPLLAITYKKD